MPNNKRGMRSVQKESHQKPVISDQTFGEDRKALTQRVKEHNARLPKCRDRIGELRLSSGKLC